MLASPVEDSRGQTFHVHFTRVPGHVIGRDTNVPYGVEPNPLERVAFLFPASELRNIDYAAYLALLETVCAWACNFKR